jgi:ribonuclease HI
MEAMAVIAALEAMTEDDVEIVSDSTYVVKMFQ